MRYEKIIRGPEGFVVTPLQCMLCGSGHQPITLTPREFSMIQAGAFIQSACPDMSEADREVLISGTHSECFDKAFGSEEMEVPC